MNRRFTLSTWFSLVSLLQILQDLGILKNARAVLIGRQRPMSGIKTHRCAKKERKYKSNEGMSGGGARES